MFEPDRLGYRDFYLAPFALQRMNAWCHECGLGRRRGLSGRHAANGRAEGKAERLFLVCLSRWRKPSVCFGLSVGHGHGARIGWCCGSCTSRGKRRGEKRREKKGKAGQGKASGLAVSRYWGMMICAVAILADWGRLFPL